MPVIVLTSGLKKFIAACMNYQFSYDIANPEHHQPYYRRKWIWLGLIILILIFLLFQAVKHRKKHIIPAAIPVVISKSQQMNVPYYLNGLGTVTPMDNVILRTQINGILLRVLFREGQFVKKGDLLAEIDPRPYQAQLLAYQGQLLRDTAILENALIDLKRYQTLWKQDSIAQQRLASQRSFVKQYQGIVQLDKGLIEQTKINLLYCEITSPVDGRVGLRLLDPGNYTTTSDTTGIAVITTLNPITVIFTLPEDQIPDIATKIYGNQSLSVEAYDRTQTKLLGKGQLITIDNQINVSTGTVRLRAQFDNRNNIYFPNQFVNVKLLVKIIENAIVVPTAAIQYGNRGPFVHLINNDNIVTIKPIMVGVTFGNNTIVTAGLSVGQSVVVEGGDKLTNGTRVSPQKPSMRKA